MEIKSAEAQYIALRMYGIELALRSICRANPNLQAMTEDWVSAYEGEALFGGMSDAHREAIVTHARLIISGPLADQG